MKQTEENRQILFEIKQKFLREIPHHKLIAKQIKQLDVKFELDKVALPSLLETKLSEENHTLSLVDYLSAYIQINLKRKHQISLALEPLTLRNELIELIREQFQFLLKLNAYVVLEKEIDLSSIKISDSIDAYFVLKSILQLNLQENEIKNYLCDIIKIENGEESPLKEVFLRVHKTILHG